MRSHLNDHVDRRELGAVPEDYLQQHSLQHCTFCSHLVHTRYNRTCPSCRTTARAAQAAAELCTRLGPSPNNNASSEAPRARLPDMDAIHSRYTPTLRHIPKELRPLWSRCLARTVANTTWNNSLAAWCEMQMIAKCVLCAPPRAGKNHKRQRTNFTRSRLNRWLAGERAELWQDLPNYQRPRAKPTSDSKSQAQRHQRCSDLCSEGGFSSACKALTKGAPLSFNNTVMEELRQKHPLNHNPPRADVLTNTLTHFVPEFTGQTSDKAIRSFHKLSGAGPSGLRPCHFQEALLTENKDELLEHTTALVTLLAKGLAPRALAPHLAGASLTALPKKDGSVRPIAVGETLRRLTAKCLCAEHKEAALSYFFPLQIGVGQPLGTEVGLQTACQWVERNRGNPKAVFVKIDFSNAFNTVDRQAFLDQCKEHFPGLFAWSSWCYAEPSNLLCGGRAISSESGVQQGDPLGPLLFSLASQPILAELASKRQPSGLQLVFSYLDDLCLAGEERAVSEALDQLTTAANQIGLKLNEDKCEVIPSAGIHHNISRSLFPASYTFQGGGDFELLGGPIGSHTFCNAHTQDRVDRAVKVLAAIGELPDPQVALLLLRQCACFGKLVYSLRLVPTAAHQDALHNFDTAVRECFESFMCASLSDEEWKLASLSTSQSGLGLRSTLQHSPAAYTASRAACYPLCRQLDPEHVCDFSTTTSAAATTVTLFNNSVSPDSRITMPAATPPTQRDLSAAIDAHTLQSIREEHRHEAEHLAHLQLTSVDSAGQWLHALPSEALHTKVEPLLFKTMVQRWLRVPLFPEPFTCSLCEGVMDIHGDHALSCCCGGDRTKRHNIIRNSVYHLCAMAGLHPELEKPGLLQPRPCIGALPEDGIRRDNPDARRPADVYLPRWRQGTPLALDFAVTSGLRLSTIRATLHDATSATTTYEDYKNSYLNTQNTCIDEGLNFAPIVIEAVGGGLGPTATKVLYSLAKTRSSISGETTNTVLNHLLQNLGINLHRANARALLRRCAPVAFDAGPILATAAFLQAQDGEPE